MSDGDDEPAADAPAEGGEPDDEPATGAEAGEEISEEATDEGAAEAAETEATEEEAPEGTAEDADAGDEEPDEADADAEPAPTEGAEELTEESLDEGLDEAEAELEAAETEADLDAVEADLDAIEAGIEEADLPEPEDEDEEAPAERLQGRVEDLRGAVEEARGPYAEDVVGEIETERERLVDAEWTEDGAADAKAAVDAFLDAVGETLGETFAVADDSLEAHADALDEAAAAAEAAGLDPDDDAATIEALLEETAALREGLDDAEEWSDLTVVQQLRARGFYDRLTSENRKDFPPELSVIRIAERENDPERILMALEKFTSDFMEENCIDALARLAPEEAYEPMMERAQKRDRPAIEVLGKVGNPEATDTLHDFIQDESNPPLQKTTLRALGEIGSEESTQAVANRLVAEDPEVRSEAARALGRIGDARAIDPLADVLADDDSDPVRASATWALVQIGTEDALEQARDYADDRSYLVQSEAEKAADALDDAEAATA